VAQEVEPAFQVQSPEFKTQSHYKKKLINKNKRPQETFGDD
jgi:hypothetical protein